MSIAVQLRVLVDLKGWLLEREYDIATGMEDFGELKEIFEEIVGRKAGPDV
mgnify:FL=1